MINIILEHGGDIMRSIFSKNGSVSNNRFWNFVILKRRPTPMKIYQSLPVQGSLLQHQRRRIAVSSSESESLPETAPSSPNSSAPSPPATSDNDCFNPLPVLPPQLSTSLKSPPYLVSDRSLLKVALFLCKYLFAFFQTNVFIAACYLSCRIANLMLTVRDAVGWGTALQAGRSRVPFPTVSLEFFIDIILPAALWPWGWLSL